MNKEDIFPQLPPYFWMSVLAKTDIRSVIRLSKTCNFLYNLAEDSLWCRGAVPDFTLVIKKTANTYLAGVCNTLAPSVETKGNYADAGVFAAFKFAEIELRAFCPALHLDVIKRSAGVCKKVIFSLEHLSGKHIWKVLSAVRPERVVVRFGYHATGEVDAYKEFDGIKYLDVETPNIDRLTPRLLRLLREHHTVRLSLTHFPFETFHHLLFQWEHGRDFGQLRRLEVNGVPFSPFTFSCERLVHNRILDSLGQYVYSATNASTISSPANGLALLITTPLRLVFVPVESKEEAIAELVYEFSQKVPMDASSLLGDANPLAKIISLESSSVPAEDDWDWD